MKALTKMTAARSKRNSVRRPSPVSKLLAPGERLGPDWGIVRTDGKRPSAPIVTAMVDSVVRLTRALSPAALAVLRAEARATGVSEAVFALRTMDMALRLAGRAKHKRGCK